MEQQGEDRNTMNLCSGDKRFDAQPTILRRLPQSRRENAMIIPSNWPQPFPSNPYLHIIRDNFQVHSTLWQECSWNRLPKSRILKCGSTANIRFSAKEKQRTLEFWYKRVYLRLTFKIIHSRLSKHCNTFATCFKSLRDITTSEVTAPSIFPTWTYKQPAVTPPELGSLIRLGTQT